MKKLFFFAVLIVGCSSHPNVAKQISTKSDTGKDTLNGATKTTYHDLNEALRNPDKVIVLKLDSGMWATKHLPASIGSFVNLKELDLACMKNLEDLPAEIGNLKSLEILDMDEGNGCQMNVSIPSSIGNLSNLKDLILYGALDNRFDSIDFNKSSPQVKFKPLPQAISKLQNLEILDLGRNGLKAIPTLVYSLHKLKTLVLDFNDITEISPSISELRNLKELSIISGTIPRLPKSMKMFKGLKVVLGRDPYDTASGDTPAQKKLREEFPNIVFSFEDAVD